MTYQEQWDKWLQGHLVNERVQNLHKVVRTINNLLEPRDAEIAKLRRELAELRQQDEIKMIRRREIKTEPPEIPWVDGR
jgi:predicted RNase H-like nuclease (RuvC/YqgF family)